MFERIAPIVPIVTIIILRAVLGAFIAATLVGGAIMLWLAWANPDGVALWERLTYLCIAGLCPVVVRLYRPSLWES